MRFDSGALGIIHGTTAAYPGLDASVRVFRTKGSAVISDDELVYFHSERRAGSGTAYARAGRRYQPGHGRRRTDR
jgi:UDP-N-acetyl-2-amino-2-deoxyglucuronate dehydrogenase